MVEGMLSLKLVSRALSEVWRMMADLLASHNVLEGSCLAEVPMRGG